jgi:hypothetical protein
LRIKRQHRNVLVPRVGPDVDLLIEQLLAQRLPPPFFDRKLRPSSAERASKALNI